MVFIAFGSRREEAGYAVSGSRVGPLVVDMRAKPGDPSLSCSREIPSEAVRGGIFDSFSPATSDRKSIMTSYPVEL